MNKEAVKDGFSGCFDTYSTEAVVQKHIAVRLTNLMGKHMVLEPKQAVEVGCGSGFLTEQMLGDYPFTSWLHNDITPSSEAFVDLIARKYHAKSCQFVVADAETMLLPSGIDLFVSSSAVQWFSNIDGFLKRLAESMNRGGVVAISTFGLQNLCQVRELTGNGLCYHTAEHLQKMASQYFEVLELHEEQTSIHFEQPVDVLRHIKLTGVNGAFRQCWTKGKLASFSEGYEAFKTEKGYPLTYHPIYLVARVR